MLFDKTFAKTKKKLTIYKHLGIIYTYKFSQKKHGKPRVFFVNRAIV